MSDDVGHDRERWVGVALFFASLALYILTLCPTVYIGDAGELSAVAWCFGVAHPPGYPLFTLLYGVCVHLVPFGEVALRANLVTAILAAGAVFVVFLAARRLGVSSWAAVSAALAMAVTRQFWSQAVAVEVYALDALLLALMLHGSIVLARAPEPSTRRWWLWFGVAVGLCCGHRPVNVPYAALLMVWVELSRRRNGGHARGWLAAILGAGATGLVFAYLPIAAARDPLMNMGDPDSLERFWAVIRAEPYARHLQSGSGQLVAERLGASLLALPIQLGVTVLVAALGLVMAGRRARTAGVSIAWVMGAVACVNLVFASFYNILDNDGFYQPTWIAVAVLAGMGWDLLFTRAPGRRVAVGSAAVLLALSPAFWTWGKTDLSGVPTVDAYSRDLLASAEPGALILVTGDTARAALAYRQVALGERRDVAVLAPTMLVPWHVEEVRRRSPDSDIPPLPPSGDPLAWLRRVVRAQLQERGRPVYLTSVEGGFDHIFDLPIDLLPTGLLYRAVIRPADPGRAHQLRVRVMAAAESGFWSTRRIPRAASRRPDPQLAILPVHYAAARRQAARALVLLGARAEAEAHLADLAGSGVDELEEEVARAYLTIGREKAPRRFAAQGRAGLEALRAGAPPQGVHRAMDAAASGR